MGHRLALLEPRRIRTVMAGACACMLMSIAAIMDSAHAAPVISVSRASIDFGRIPPGVPSSIQPVFVTNAGDAPLTIAGVAVTGANASDITIGGTCAPASVLPANGRCRIELVMTALTGFAARSATLAITSDAARGTSTVQITGTLDIGSQYRAPPDPDVDWLDFAPQPVGSAAPAQTLNLYNGTDLRFVVTSVAITGANASDFSLATTCPAGSPFPVVATCAFTIGFTPSGNGPRSAELTMVLTFSGVNGTFAYSLTGVGGAGAAPATALVVEYYNPTLDHYFITWANAEQENLDAGKTPTRWSRTGYSFNTYREAQPGTSPVCRYYLPPQFGDSHFFGRGALECAQTGQKNPGFVLEDSAFMQLFLPTAGMCAPGTTPIYRVFSNRPDANHRYMTDRTVRDQMAAKGWTVEGDGPDFVVMCAP